MFRTRFWLAIAVLGLTLGLLLATAGYGLYLRSGMHADAVAQQASEFLQAPVQIGGITPLDAGSRGLRDVQVWLPGEFSPIFTCKTAVVRQVDSQSAAMDLRDGRIEARTDDWDRSTLGQLLATAFAHDFGRIRLKTIRLENMDVVVRRGRLSVRLAGASGQIDLTGTAGRIDLVCDGFNGVRTGEPLRVHCEFEPGERPLVRELSLAVQRLGIEAFAGEAGFGGWGTGRVGTTVADSQVAAQAETTITTMAAAGPKITQIAAATTTATADQVGRTAETTTTGFLTPAAGSSPSQVPEGVRNDSYGNGNRNGDDCGNNSNGANGRTEAGTASGLAGVRDAAAAGQGGAGWFTGRIVYRQKARGSLAGVVELAGSIGEIRLAALGARACKTRLAGTVSGTLDRAVLEDGQLRVLEGRLRVADVDLRELLKMAGLPAAQGAATLDLHELRYEDGAVQALLAEAQVRDLDVEPLMQPLRSGVIRGRIDATIHKLKIIEGRLEELSGEARMVPRAGAAGTVDRSMLEAAMQRLCNVSLPPILPEQVPYTEVGARFRCEGDDLYIDGAVGPQEKFVLVLDMGSVPLPLVPAPATPIAMGALRQQVQGQIGRLGRAAAEWARQKLAAQE